ncbi:hypothetical protein TorRG33x02_215480 [Trema orientale]|uniref:Uncharacterized protein n=1 Tax=Trema orientale TaxID=63057 RepID=A0A2P5EAP6_TREOI|nr:hypothetical protein TorRG33x02_215480 [Trema orientale]
MTSVTNSIRANAVAVHGAYYLFRGNQISTEARNKVNVVQSLFMQSAITDLSRHCSTFQHGIVSTSSAHICDSTCMLYRPNKKSRQSRAFQQR